MAYTTIDKPTDYFNTKLYAGNSGTQSITGVNFQPDFLWIKRRTLAGDHNLVDVIRTSDKTLITNATGGEYSNATITSFDSDGFSLSGSDGALNGSGSNYVAWNWLASNTTASNTDGSITSTVSASITSGFSCVSYTGTGSNATVGHGLGSVPKMIIVKKRSGTSSWAVYNENIGNANGLFLNSTSGTSSEPAFWNSTSPTSSVFSVGTSGDTNGSGATEIAYCFAEKKGFSKFGSYTGNGNADGTFIYTGFSPSFVMVKASSTTGNWTMFDNKRSPFNFVDNHLYANTNVAEQTASAGYIDFLSNGFKKTDTFNNASGATYIYMALAESPFTTSTGIPTTAR